MNCTPHTHTHTHTLALVFNDARMLIYFSSQKSTSNMLDATRCVNSPHSPRYPHTLCSRLMLCAGLFARFNLVIFCVLRTAFTSRAFLVTAALHSLLSFHSRLSLSSLTRFSRLSRNFLCALVARSLLFPLFKSHSCFTSLSAPSSLSSGMPKEHAAALSLALTPVQIVIPMLVTKYVAPPCVQPVCPNICPTV